MYDTSDWNSDDMPLGWKALGWAGIHVLPWAIIAIVVALIAVIFKGLISVAVAYADVVIIPDNSPYPTICIEQGGVTICN